MFASFSFSRAARSLPLAPHCATHVIFYVVSCGTVNQTVARAEGFLVFLRAHSDVR